MEVLKEKVEEEEAANQEAEAEQAERGEKRIQPQKVRRKGTFMSQEMLRDLEKKLLGIEITVPEKPL